MKRHFVGAGLLLSITACQLSTGGESPSVVVRTDGSTFARHPEHGVAEVPFTIENLGTRAIDFVYCGDRLMTAVDRREDGQWVQYSGDACQAVYVVTARSLEPGATLRTGRSFGEAGRYRLRPLAPAADGSRHVWEPLTSNEFTVR